MGEWREVVLEDVATVTVGHVGPMASEYVAQGIPFLRSQNVERLRINDTDLKYIDPDFHGRLKKSALAPDDVVIVRTGKPGTCAVIPQDLPVANCSDLVIVRCDADLDPRFLAYYVNSVAVQHVNSHLVGAVQQHFNVGSARNMGMYLPDLPEQHAITHILGTLDDKIELNRRMGETLEAMARALFKSWFVDFEPVRAKAEGRDTGLPESIADLFPARLVDSELGEIPEGWGIHPLSDCVDIARGLSYKGSGLSSNGLPMHNLNSIHEGGGYKHEGIKYYNDTHKPKHMVRSGDVIVANTEQGHDRLLIGFAAIVPARYREESLFSHHIYRVSPKSLVGLTSDYVCQLLNTQAMHDTVSGYANGTTVNMLPSDALEIPQILLPYLQIVSAYTDLAQAARERQEKLIDESRTLATIRDTLLPKLISGELRVKDAGRTIERTIQ